MVTRAEAEVAVKSKILYYIVYFGSFVLAVKIIPWVESIVKGYTENSLMIMAGTWLVAWLGSMLLIPQILFYLISMMMED